MGEGCTAWTSCQWTVVGVGGGGGDGSYGVVMMVVDERLFFLDSRCITVGTLIFGLTDGREACGGCDAMLQ